MDFTSGTFDAQNGRVDFVGNTAQDIKGNITFNNIRINNSSGGVEISQDTTRVQGMFLLQSGSFNTNDMMIVLSNATGDGSIGPVSGGSISGDVVMQRYIDVGATNWRFLGSPTTNGTIAQWIDDFITSGFPGSHFPTFPFESIRAYDETVLGYKDSGFVSVSSVDNITSGQGFWVYCGDSLGGTAPFTIDVTGPVYQGAFNFSVTYTGAVGDTNNGWNLLANPYPSAIDWDDASWSRSNVNNSIYMWNSDQDQYSSYVGGVGTNNGSNIIPQGHGFYVKASDSPASLSVTEQAKVDTTVAFLRPRRVEDLLVRMKISQGYYRDETVIRSNASTSEQFDSDFDAYHFPASGRNPLQLFSRVGKYDYTINTVNLHKTDTIPIYIAGDKNEAILQVNIENQPSTTCLYLWDRTEDELHVLTGEDAFDIDIESPDVYHKYSLIVRDSQSDCNQLLSSKPAEETVLPKWVFFSGTELVMLRNEERSQPFKIYDLHGRMLTEGIVSNTRIPFHNMPSGLYLLQVGPKSMRFVNP